MRLQILEDLAALWICASSLFLRFLAAEVSILATVGLMGDD